MNFWMTDKWVRAPILGLIARNAKNFVQGKNGWLNAEEKLCGVYKKYVSQLPEEKFIQRIEYLKHAGDLGRTPMSVALKSFLFLLIAAEALGFSYILGTWAAMDGSANLYTKLMYGIVFVLASILATLTHNAGSQFYRTKLIRSCYARYKESGDSNFHSTRVISLSDDQFADANERSHTRCINRIIENPHDMGSYGWSWAAGIFIALIFVGSAVMRYSHMETELNRQSQAADAAVSNPFAASNMPAELVAPQQASDRKAKAEERSSIEVEGTAAIMVLSVIFVVTQIVGFGAGYKHSFAGKESYKKAAGTSRFWFWSEMDGAYADTWGYSTYDSYWQAMQPIKDIVNERLKDLQHILETNSPRNLNLSKTFDDYLEEQLEISRRGREAANTIVPRATQAAPVASVTAPALSNPADDPMTGIERAKAAITTMSDKQAQQDYFVSLPPTVREALKPWLKERKEQAAAAVSKAELEDLF